MSQLPPVEAVSKLVHEDWMKKKHEAGITSRMDSQGHEIMVPWDFLPEEAREENRALVATVYAAIEAAIDAA